MRLGTPAATTRGMTEPEMRQIARWIDEGIEAAKRQDETTIERIASEIRDSRAGSHTRRTGLTEPASRTLAPRPRPSATLGLDDREDAFVAMPQMAR